MPAPVSAPATPLLDPVPAAETPQIPAAILGDGNRPAPMVRPLGESPAGKIVRYAESVIRKHDANGNGRLEEQEWRGVAGNPQEADLNHDGTITQDELVLRIVVYGRHRSLRLVNPAARSAAGLGVTDDEASSGDPNLTGLSPTGDSPGTFRADAGAGSSNRADLDAERAREQARRSRQFYIPRDRLPAGIASWFIDRDADGDGQITMREFSANWSADVAAQFSAYDRNGDGVVTAAESVAAAPKAKADDTVAGGSAEAAPRPNSP